MYHVQPITYSSVRASIAVPFNLLQRRNAQVGHTTHKDLDRQLMSHAHWYFVNLFRCTGPDFGVCSLSWTFEGMMALRQAQSTTLGLQKREAFLSSSGDRGASRLQALSPRVSINMILESAWAQFGSIIG